MTHLHPHPEGQLKGLWVSQKIHCREPSQQRRQTHGANPEQSNPEARQSAAQQHQTD